MKYRIRTKNATILLDDKDFLEIERINDKDDNCKMDLLQNQSVNLWMNCFEICQKMSDLISVVEYHNHKDMTL